MIQSLKTSGRNQAILCDYCDRDTTRWSEQEQYKDVQKYKYRIREIHVFEDELDEEVNHHIEMHLSDKKQHKSM